MKVTVVTTTLNAAYSIQACVASVRHQTTAAEHIVVDGGSSDKTLDILTGLLATNPRLQVVSVPEASISKGFNVGIGMARSDVISILNADDWLEPLAVERSIKALQENPEAAFTYGSIIIRGQDGSRRFSPTSNPEAVASRYMPFPHISSFVRRSVYEKHGLYDETYKIAMDMEFYARICKAGVKGVRVDAVIGHASGGGVSTRFWPRFRENFRITTRYSGLHTAIGTFLWFGPRVLAFNILRHFPAVLRRMPTRHFCEEEESHV